MGEHRVRLFIDSQNFYRDARRALNAGGTGASNGQVDLVKLGNLLLSRASVDLPPRMIDEIHVYVGIPSPDRDPHGHAAHMRQRRAWETAGVHVHGRPLAYRNGNAEEKGIDVALAVDVVFNAARRNYDVGVIVTTDTDILPALEAVTDMQRAWGTPRLEVCSWRSAKKRLSLKGTNLWCHWLENEDYELIADPTRYGKDPA